MKRLNDKIEIEENKPLYEMTVEVTPDGFYKISNDHIKWYDSYANVKNFNLALGQIDKQDIPYTFIRIGEDVGDIEIRNNWTEDIPDEINSFEPETEIYDESEGSYKTIMEHGKDVKYKDLFTPPEEKESEEE